MGNEIIKNVAAELTKNNQTINVYAGSILSSINPVYGIQGSDFQGIDVKLANVLGNEVSYIKDSIIPVMKEFGKEVNTILGDKINKSLFTDINIITAEVPEVIEELISRNIININGVMNTKLSNNAVLLPTPEVEVIRSYIKAGGGQMDKMVKDFAMTISDADLKRIWTTYLNRITADNTSYIGLGTKVTDGRYALDLFVLSIIAKNLIHEMPTGVRATAGMYNDVIGTLNIVLDAKISNLVKLINSNAKIGKVILKADTLKTIVVVKEAYDKFLNNGGEPEVIYGAVLAGAKTAGMTTLTNNKETYLKEWNKYVSAETMKNKMATLEQYRMAYRLGIQNVVTNFMDTASKSKVNETLLDNIGMIIIEFMNEKNYMDLFDVNAIVEEFVCDVMYHETNASSFIGYMKSYSKMDPSLTPEKAAKYASVDLLVDYLLTQIEII